jgi:hypothetical protein
MGRTAATVEIPDGEVGDLVAEHFEKERDRRHGKLGGQPNDATLDVGSCQ